MRNRLILTILFCFLLAQPAYSMSTVKGWINNIRPGTFEMPEDANQAKLPGEEEKKDYTTAELRVLQSLRVRQADLDRKEQEIQKKAQELKILSQQIEQKLDQMRGLQSEIERRRKERQEMDEKDITRMVKYYETMAPENTAVFFNQMDRVTATHILMRMNPRKASAVMQLLDPKVAVDITELVTRFKTDREELAR